MLDILSGLSHEWQVFLLSMVPVVELRGAIPLGAYYQIGYITTFLLAVVGNMLPVPFIIWLIRPIFAYFKKTRLLSGLVHRFEKKTMKKADKVMKYSALGLLLFVSIPLPGTGAWTGAAIAALLNMKARYAVPCIFAGILIAGVLVTGVSYGFIQLSLWL